MDPKNRRTPRFSPFTPPGLPPLLDCLIVLGARLNPRGEPGRVAKLRLRHALKLWRDHHPGCRLIISGGQKPGAAITEARAMADWSLAWVEANWGPGFRELLEPCLLLEEASLNTAASAANTLPLVQGLNRRTVGLVTDALHLQRAHFLFKRHFYRHGIALQPLPAPGLFEHYWRQRHYLRLTRMALREAGAWLKVLGGLLTSHRRGE
jgi:hypothetical protein